MLKMLLTGTLSQYLRPDPTFWVALEVAIARNKKKQKSVGISPQK